MSLPVILVGGGGHARVLIDALLLNAIEVIGFTDLDSTMQRRMQGICCIGDDLAILRYLPSEVHLVNAIGSISSTKHRCMIYDVFKSKGYSFSTVIHPSAIVSRDVMLSEGVQIMAGAIIQAGAAIKENTIINTKASIDHDCEIGAHVHIAPGATLSGGVCIEANVHIGTGATIIQNIHIGCNSIIGAGAVVLNDIPADCTVYGIPAKGAKV